MVVISETLNNFLNRAQIISLSKDDYSLDKELAKHNYAIIYAYNYMIEHGAVGTAGRKTVNMTGASFYKRFKLSEDEITEALLLAPEIIGGLNDEQNAANPAPETTAPLPDAEQIYLSGTFISYCLEQFRKIWLYDEHILKAILYQTATYKLLNPNEGIHLHILGNTQVGKSNSVLTALKFIPEQFKSIRTFSPKWLFHASKLGKIHENLTVFTDDTKFDPEVAAIYRNMLSMWNTGIDRGTVINNEAVDLHIPKHISLILTSIDDIVMESEEGQDESRFLELEVRRSEEQKEAVRIFIQSQIPVINTELATIHAIWNLIPSREVALHRVFEDKMTNRELKRFLTLLKCNALLHNRTATTEADYIEIKEFLTNSKPMIDDMTPAMKRDELVVFNALTGKPLTVSELQDKTKISYLRIIRALHGREGTFDKPKGGLLATVRNLIIGRYEDTNERHFHLRLEKIN